MLVLVVNAGSSSLKLRLLDDDSLVRSADLDAGPDGFDAAPLADILSDWATPDVVGHRIVHGGTIFTGPALVDDAVRSQLRDLTDLAPLHQPKSLAALDAVTAQLPDVLTVACFDTAFHTTIPDAASTFAVPRTWRHQYGIRRYGFHGLSHGYGANRAAALVNKPMAGLRIITCHLGAGASLAAVLDGRSVDTTMGFTPLDGLVMATRSGTFDPGAVLWLQEHEHLSVHEVAVALEEQSGLTALAGSGDMRKVEAAAGDGDAAAVLALDVYVHRLAGAIAAMSAATGGLDVLVFTGGVGEHSPTVRRRAVERLAFLGAVIDSDRNEHAHGDRDISTHAAPVRTVVVTAREDLQIAREVRVLLSQGPSDPTDDRRSSKGPSAPGRGTGDSDGADPAQRV